jgi:hypothetical protein
MAELKRLEMESIASALEKVDRYRLLNDPEEAESICRDILAIDPENAKTRIALILSLTDQFGTQLTRTFKEACDLASGLDDEYAQLYYHGIICERRAMQAYRRGGPSAGYIAYDWLHQAMEHYDKAAASRPSGDDSALLRWNACVRKLERHPDMVPEPLDDSVQLLE